MFSGRLARACGITFLTMAIAAQMSGSGALGQIQAAPALPAQANPQESGLARGINLLEQHKDEEAKKVLAASLKQLANDPVRSTQLLNLLAVIEYKEDQYARARRYLVQIRDSQTRMSTLNATEKMALNRRIADSYYLDYDFDEAALHYKLILLSARTMPPDDPNTSEVLESLVGALVARKHYTEAEPYCKQLVEIAGSRKYSGDLNQQAGYFWSLLELRDIYVHTGNTQALAALRETLWAMMQEMLVERSKLEAEGNLIALYDRARWQYAASNQPRTIPETIWLFSEYKPKTLPLIAWRDKDVPLKATILCVHGLGLENVAFTVFGRQMAKRGYLVYALDVRGFGAWMAAPGNETLAFSKTFNDIKRIIELIREKQAGVPVFLLGESMGGAIALRSAAQFGQLMNGVISSVPSAERFQERRMAFSVAVHLLRDPNKPFNIGEQIATQATARENLLALWMQDPKGKTKLSPKELINFALFMRGTERECKKITKTPVFVVQGLKDQLVKPKGSFDLFAAVPNPDKNLLIIGEAEHLIFETDNQTEVLIDALDSWMGYHVTPASPAPQQASGNQL